MTGSAASVPSGPDCNGTTTETGYYATAIPVRYGTTGQRSFAMLSPADAIWQIHADAAPTEPFGAPAAPIQ